MAERDITLDAELVDDLLAFIGDQADYADDGMNQAARLWSRLECERVIQNRFAPPQVKVAYEIQPRPIEKWSSVEWGA